MSGFLNLAFKLFCEILDDFTNNTRTNRYCDVRKTIIRSVGGMC